MSRTPTDHDAACAAAVAPAQDDAPRGTQHQSANGDTNDAHNAGAKTTEETGCGVTSGHSSPATRLYRHALESILGMLTLADLAQIVAVSREWSAAVRSMAPIAATLARDSVYSKDFRPLPPLARLAASPLLRDLAAVHICHGGALATSLDNASFALLAQHAPNLQSLWGTLTLTPNEPLILPAKLRSMQLQIDQHYPAASLNGVLAALAALPSLSELTLRLSAFVAANARIAEDAGESGVDLSILAACPSLTTLVLETGGSILYLRDAQVEQIRSSLGHLHRIELRRMPRDMLARLLQPPVTARWQDIGRISADAHTGDLLLRLNSLTKLDLFNTGDAAHADFLPQLPHLTAFNLQSYKYVGGVQHAWYVPANAVLASLMRCTSIIELFLCCGFNSAHWSALFAKLALKKLTIRRGEIDTLQCFATGPITESLEELTLEQINLPSSEVPHLYALRRLRTLHLNYCFSPRLDGATIDRLSPPTSLLPALTELWEHRAEGYVERHGPSFEGLQQRRVQ